MQRRSVLALVSFVTTIAQADGPKYQTMNGCDEGRWREWESIIIGFDGDPVEQEDARYVRDVNRQACEDWKSGKLTADQANEGYSREVDAWTKRVEQREMRRRMKGAGPARG